MINYIQIDRYFLDFDKIVNKIVISFILVALITEQNKVQIFKNIR
jgi:hypothetical protein